MTTRGPRRNFTVLIAAAVYFSLSTTAPAAVHYVNINSASPTAPYTSWASAATVIQDAVDAAAPGDQVLVTNGIYQTGGHIVFGSMSNRVAVTTPITLQSVNGAAVTVIQGQQNPGTITGSNAVRCVYLTNNATLLGFTLTNGATRDSGDALKERSGGGAWCESNAVITACTIVGNQASDSGGGVNGGIVNNCTLTKNSAGGGGGAKDANLTSCLVSGNSAGDGGGVLGGFVNGCTLTGNSAGDAGGGADFCTLTNCVLTDNTAYVAGGGVYAATANNCTMSNNWSNAGGGAGFCTLNNCLIIGNSANWAGGSTGGSVNNCTIVGNFAYAGAGIFGGQLNNCIVYYNIEPDAPGAGNYAFGEISGSMSYSCTTPMPDTGVSNITAEPKLASPSHLSAGSPCLGAGTAAHVSGVDIDGEPWSNPPPMGCDQFNASATGPLAVSIHPEFTTVAKGFALNLVGDIRGNCNASVWDFADGNILSNRPFASHAWATAGDFSVVLRAFNSSFPAGISATQLIHVVDGFYYVSLSSTNPVSPFTSWGTAATNIQDAADVAAVGGTVLVTNGVYRNGGRVAYPGMTNRLVINKTITVRSVNGPSVTAIEGHQNPTNILGDDAIRCVYMTNRATLSGFMLTNGASLLDGNEAFDYNLYTGGGVYSESAAEVVTNCVIVNCASSDYGGGAEQGTLIDSILRGNSCLNGGTGGGADAATLNHCSLFSNWSTQNGGGVSRSTLNRCLLTNNASTNGGATAFSTVNNCLLVGNTAIWGGGDYGSIMYNCTIVSNSAQIGGGGNGSVLYNCIAYDNSAPDGTNYAYGIQRYSCTTPWPGGSGNFTNAPLFVNEAGGNFRLQSNSPCINASANALAPSGPDLDGNPRIAGTTVDVGAYEFQSPTSVIAYWWLQQYGLPLDGSIDFNDPDHDGMNNWQESLADTNPTNTLSVLKLLPLAATNNSAGIVVTWQSIGTRTYFLQRSTNLPTFQTLATDIGGQDGTTSYTDETAVGRGPFFYRVGVQ